MPAEWAFRERLVSSRVPRPALEKRCKGIKTGPRPVQNSLWIPLPQEPILEKTLFGLLVLGSVIGLVYGFCSVLDLVQNWVSINVR